MEPGDLVGTGYRSVFDSVCCLEASKQVLWCRLGNAVGQTGLTGKYVAFIFVDMVLRVSQVVEAFECTVAVFLSPAVQKACLGTKRLFAELTDSQVTDCRFVFLLQKLKRIRL